MSDLLRKEKTFPRQSQLTVHPYKPGKVTRYFKNIGLGFKTPETAINGTYIDKKCPFTGDVKITGGIFKGVVLKMKQERTIVVMKNYFHYNQKYKRFERRNSKFNVHLSPCFFGLIRVGDIVTCGGVRPLSKTKRFVVIDYQQTIGQDNKYPQFTEM